MNTQRTFWIAAATTLPVLLLLSVALWNRTGRPDSEVSNWSPPSQSTSRRGHHDKKRHHHEEEREGHED